MEKGFIKEMVAWLKAIIVTLVIVFIFRQFIFTPTIVRGESMMPTLQDGNRVMVVKMTEINRFDEVVFKAIDSNDNYVKRVIGLPGDRITMKDDTLYINGKAYDEPYLDEYKDKLLDEEKLTGDFSLKELTNKGKVPEGQMFVLGDNRLYSKDSRSFGFVPMNRIIGEVKIKFWPINEIGFAD